MPLHTRSAIFVGVEEQVAIAAEGDILVALAEQAHVVAGGLREPTPVDLVFHNIGCEDVFDKGLDVGRSLVDAAFLENLTNRFSALTDGP